MKTETIPLVRAAGPRETALVRFPDGRHFEAPLGTPAEEYLEAALADNPVPFIAALVNGDLNAMAAFMQGKVKVKGEMALALKLQSIFGMG